MSITPKILQGKAGTVQDQVLSGVIHMFWSKARTAYGDTVVAGALLSGWEDGTAVKLKVFERDEGDGADDDPVIELEAQIEACFAKAEWTIDFQDPDQDEGGEYEFYFLVEVDGEVLTTRDDAPILYADLLPPEFSS